MGAPRILTVVLVNLAVVSLTAPVGADPPTPRRDSVRGSAVHLGADDPSSRITIEVRATSDADGSHPKGHMRIEVPDIGLRRRAVVTCLAIRGNTATIGIRITKAEDPEAVGKGELFNIVDNGSAGDEIAGYPVTDTVPTECPPLDFSVPVVEGNYSFADAA